MQAGRATRRGEERRREKYVFEGNVNVFMFVAMLTWDVRQCIDACFVDI